MKRERIEEPVNPEEVWGDEFKIPTIVGQGSGQGFEFDGLHLPKGWETAIPELKEIEARGFKGLFLRHCQEIGRTVRKINFDSLTCVLTKLTFEKAELLSLASFLAESPAEKEEGFFPKPVSGVSFAESFPEREKGIYKAHHIKDIREAVMLQRVLSIYLGYFGMKCGTPPYPYISGGVRPMGYFPVDLKIPERFLGLEKPLTNSHSQETLRMRASNIAGRFGHTLKWIQFDEQGIPTEFQLGEGSRCYYGIDRQGEYYAHNVDTLYQAAALQGMAALFINDFLPIRE